MIVKVQLCRAVVYYCLGFIYLVRAGGCCRMGAEGGRKAWLGGLWLHDNLQKLSVMSIEAGISARLDVIYCLPYTYIDPQ